MTPYEELKGLSKDVVAAAWQQQCGHCRAVQERVLMDILARAKDTEIGRRFHFDQIKSIADYQRQVPVMEYGDFQAAITAMADGQSDVLFSGVPKLFLQTSGTTGQPKLVPESFLGSGSSRPPTGLSRYARPAADHRRAGPAFGRRRTDRFRFQRQRPQEQYAAAHDLSVRDRPSSG